MILVVQIVSGIFLAMFYCPNDKFAFLSVAELSWDIFNGHFLRYFHANGASVFVYYVLFYLKNNNNNRLKKKKKKKIRRTGLGVVGHFYARRVEVRSHEPTNGAFCITCVTGWRHA